MNKKSTNRSFLEKQTRHLEITRQQVTKCDNKIKNSVHKTVKQCSRFTNEN